ncbi:MAG: FtsX-like permease family protein [Bacteroidales bacterium]|nr:FtsX-like permease family protein [Bacteroidales bacterium]
MENLKLAWRNLWRNRRRTMITAASVFFAVFFALFMRSLQLGSYDYMYKNVIESYSGNIQLQQKEWWDEKTIDNSFGYNLKLEERLLSDNNIVNTIPRLESFALASSGSNTKGVMVMGIDPEKESLLSDISKKVAKYHLSADAIAKILASKQLPEKATGNLPLFENVYYDDENRLLQDLGLNVEKKDSYLPVLARYSRIEGEQIKVGEPGVWLGQELAKYLEVQPGDTMVLMGQGYHGTTAAGKYQIKGIIKIPASDISGRIVYLPYDVAQELFHAENNLTSLILHVRDNSDKAIAETSQWLSEKIPDETRIIDWKEMNDVIIQQMEADNVSGMFMIGILYIVIAFGIIGTVLMMTAERRREFGVLVAIGMQKKKLASIVGYEMMMIGLLGVMAGIIISIPIILYGVNHPIVFKGELAHMMEEYDFEPKLVFETVSYYYLWQAFVVALMVLVSLIHPVRKILRLKVVNALRA